MSNVILPFLLSMMLGRTIDLTTYTIKGVNIFDDADYDEVPAPSLNTTFNVLQSSQVPYAYFGIPIDVVLRMKSNFLGTSSGAMGLEGLLKDTSWKYNSAIVSATTIYRTVDRNLKKDAAQLDGWADNIPTEQTHYAKTLFYGGWSVVLFRFKCQIAGDVPFVRNVLTKYLGVAGPLTEDILDKWDQAVDAIEKSTDIRGSVTVIPHVYSTIPFRGSIESPRDLMKIIEKFPTRGGKLGTPLFMDLAPISELNNKFTGVTESNLLQSELEKLDEMSDDVKVTKQSIIRWVTETFSVFTDEEEDRIDVLLDKASECIKEFRKLSADVSLYKPINREKLESALQKYLNGLDRGTTTYNMAYRRLKEEIDAQCEGQFLNKIRGLLRVYDDEMLKKGEVKGGLEECKKLCLSIAKCRAIGYADHISELDIETGLYHKKVNQCWIYFKSTSTAPVNTPNGLSGDMGIYDRRCY